jgi:retron-type reverse transcriptase
MRFPVVTTDLLGLPKIRDVSDLSFHTHLSESLLHSLYFASEKYYKVIDIPKKNGKIRRLACPSPAMKAIQAWVLRKILENIDIHTAATGFIVKKNTRDNVEPHQNNCFFLCLDIKDFFTSIKKENVFSFFKALGYKWEVANILATYCTYQDSLPQGGVTSPALSNILCIALDRRLNAYVGGKNITYTRYADDMIFSAQSRERLLRARSTIEEIIKDEKFLLNDEKTRLLGPGQQIKLTGLVISTHQQKDKTIGVGREEKRIIRAKLHKLINSQAEETAIMHLKGWLNYLNSVDSDSLKYLKEYSRKFSGLNENDELLVRLFPNSTEPQTRSKQ